MRGVLDFLVVGGDGVHDLGREVVALRDLGADLGVRALDLVVDRLAHVVEQAAHLGRLHVEAQLGGDDGRQAARLDGVDEHVLAVAGAVLEAAQELDDLRGQGRNAGVVDGLLAGLAHHEVDLRTSLGDDLLDASGVDAAVGHELGQGQAGDLAADRVEGADDDRLGGVVDDQVDARGLLEGADVATLAADDAALHLVVGQVDGADRVLGGVVRRDALHRRDDDLAGALLGLVAGRSLDRLGDADCVALRLVADRLEELGLGLVGASCR